MACNGLRTPLLIQHARMLQTTSIRLKKCRTALDALAEMKNGLNMGTNEWYARAILPMSG